MKRRTTMPFQLKVLNEMLREKMIKKEDAGEIVLIWKNEGGSVLAIARQRGFMQ